MDKDDLPVSFLRAVHRIMTTNSRSVVDSSEEEQSADKCGEESDGSEDIEEREYSNLMRPSVI